MNIKYITQTIVRDELDKIYLRLLTLCRLYSDGSPESVAKVGKIDDAINHILQLRTFLCEEERKMKKKIKAEDWQYNSTYGDYQYTGDKAKYEETRQALPTNRVLNGSRDNGYMAEYTGYGSIETIPVIAVYLLEDDQEDIENEEDYDWEKALENGRIIIDVDALTDDDYETVKSQLRQ